jgi:hypothetical protein
VQRASTTAWYCIPLRLAYLENFFADTACSKPAAYYPGYAQQTCGVTPTAIQDSTTSGAFQQLILYEVGAKIPAAYMGSSTSCNKWAAPDSLFASFYVPGASIPLASLPPITVKNEGSGRVLAKVARTESGAFAAMLGFFDTTKNADCQPMTTSDGKLRCLPGSTYFINEYADDKCTQALYANYPTNPAAAAGTLIPTNTGVAGQSAVYAVGAKIARPTMVYDWNGTTCQMNAPSTTDDYYATTLVPPTDFVEVVTAPE